MIELAPAEYQALRERLRAEIEARAAAGAAAPAAAPELAARIEHTCLRSEAGAGDIERLCAEAVEWGFAGVCVLPDWVSAAAARLRDTPVRVVTVAAFPHGASLASVQRFEVSECLKLGADELDLAIPIAAARAGEWGVVRDRVGSAAELVHAAGGRLKAILETGWLDPAQIEEAARVCAAAGADFVKTSTGFGPRGATVEDVRRLRAAAPATVGIKAAGGIRSRAEAEALVGAGADRLGTSAGIEIVRAG